MSTINPGSDPVPDASLDHATANIAAFVDGLAARGVQPPLPAQASEIDTDGRFAWHIGDVQVPMPGVAAADVQGTAGRWCLKVDSYWWWWNDAIGQVVGKLPVAA